MKTKIGKDGAHLFGCECESCTATNATCPKCGTKYYADPERPELEECPHCMWIPEQPAVKPLCFSDWAEEAECPTCQYIRPTKFIKDGTCDVCRGESV